MVGLPILRQAFLFGIVLYIWGMNAQQFRNITSMAVFILYLISIGTVWACHYFMPYNGSYEYALNHSITSGIVSISVIVICCIASLFITDPTPHTAWWDGVHEMD